VRSAALQSNTTVTRTDTRARAGHLSVRFMAMTWVRFGMDWIGLGWVAHVHMCEKGHARTKQKQAKKHE
jgi:hypothetical protein